MVKSFSPCGPQRGMKKLSFIDLTFEGDIDKTMMWIREGNAFMFSKCLDEEYDAMSNAVPDRLTLFKLCSKR
jgi:hypothetical protein